MREIKRLTEKHIDAYTDIAYNAYPSFKDLSPEAVAGYKSGVREIMENDKSVHFFGLFGNETLIAVMRVFMFQMNYFGRMIPASGLGYLGVHLLHKKKGAARALIAYYEKFSKTNKAYLGLLLPFRPDITKNSVMALAANGISIASALLKFRFIKPLSA